ncbi:MAG: hypothetical protein E7Z77_00650 [Methanobrevibacter sp.]|uniref:hypothetical protein n=1 Tax=Methanobrevibacter sp. TaxID=66852 RepID=UPI0025E89CDF|nr:hypothetical protein [Methanobrevibacter sp.]MBE6507900.1 hypothetical protein [Methanobrevibacter sp.]
MDRYNEFELNEDFMDDIEFLRFEKMIEERESYEEKFLSMEPYSPCDEIDSSIRQYEIQIDDYELMHDDSEDFDLDYPFEYNDLIMKERDKKLIKEREEYELNHSEIVLDYFALNDFFEVQIAAMEEDKFIEINGYDYDYKYEPEYEDYEYDQYEEDMFWKLFYLKESQFTSQPCGCAYLDYMPNDNGFCDYLDCYDYPEGPDENLCGINYY